MNGSEDIYAKKETAIGELCWRISKLFVNFYHPQTI